MIHIAYTLDKSAHHGIGLFAAEPLSKGQIVYTASPLLDRDITHEQFLSLSASEQREIQWWGYWIEERGLWHIDFDVSRFINHSPDATLTQLPDKEGAWLVATRDITAGEELTQNYLEFESAEDLKKRGIAV